MTPESIQNTRYDQEILAISVYLKKYTVILLYPLSQIVTSSFSQLIFQENDKFCAFIDHISNADKFDEAWNWMYDVGSSVQCFKFFGDL